MDRDPIQRSITDQSGSILLPQTQVEWQRITHQAHTSTAAQPPSERACPPCCKKLSDTVIRPILLGLLKSIFLWSGAMFSRTYGDIGQLRKK